MTSEVGTADWTLDSTKKKTDTLIITNPPKKNLKKKLNLDSSGAWQAKLHNSDHLGTPLVQRPMNLELQGTDAVGDALDGIPLAVSEVVHRVDAPLVPWETGSTSAGHSTSAEI